MIITVMLTLIQKKLPSYVEADTYDIQVLTPMRKGLLGGRASEQDPAAVPEPARSGKKQEREWASTCSGRGIR